MDSALAAWMKPQVFTSTTPASSAEVKSQPDAVSRAASSSESTSLRAQPSVTRLTVRITDPAGRGDPEGEDTPESLRGEQGPPVRLTGLGTRRRTRLGAGRGTARRTEVQRHREGGVDEMSRTVHREGDPAGVAQPDAHRLVLRPGHGAARRDDPHEDLRAVAGPGEQDPTLLGR